MSKRTRSQAMSKCILGGPSRFSAMGEPRKQNADSRRAREGRQAVKRSGWPVQAGAGGTECSLPGPNSIYESDETDPAGLHTEFALVRARILQEIANGLR